MFNKARPESGSCGNNGLGCHQSAVPQDVLTVTQLFLVGLPEDGYTGGERYPLTVLVLGPWPRGGFNLEASEGTLQKVDDTVRTKITTECDVLAADTGCTGFAGNSCSIIRNDACAAPTYDRSNAACQWCPSGDAVQCRPCDNAAPLSVQATHTARKDVPVWDVVWTAPATSAGEVKFWLSGNSVDGIATQADAFDHWAVLAEPMTIAPAAP
jgi:hypothetical protein